MKSQVCEFCGKEFDSARKARYCSDRCRHHQRPLVIHEQVCVFCGKEFETKASNAKFCSGLCMGRYHNGYETLAAFEKAQAERKAAAFRPARDGSYGLTEAEMLAVDRAQDGDRDQLWRLSQSWTPRQRKYAKDRFIRIHNLFAATWNP